MTPQDAEAEMNSFRLTAMTIAELVSLRMNGALIQFTEVTDSVTVYNLIIQHLNDWAEIARGGIFDTMPPAEELFIIDEMAADCECGAQSVRLPASQVSPMNFHVRKAIDRRSTRLRAAS